MSLNCPICSQGGLPDYRVQHTICPQCNSDLEAFLILNLISKAKAKNKLNIHLFFLIGIGFLLFIFLYFKNKKENEKLLTANKIVINLLKDSINVLRNTDSFKIHNPEIKNNTEPTIIYIVKSRDCLWKIAKFFYGDANKYSTIENDNNLKTPYTLKIGQKLNITLTRY